MPYITYEMCINVVIINNVVIMVIVCGRFVDTLQKKTGFFSIIQVFNGYNALYKI